MLRIGGTGLLMGRFITIDDPIYRLNSVLTPTFACDSIFEVSYAIDADPFAAILTNSARFVGLMIEAFHNTQDCQR
jgi:hypothetical protein